MPRTRFRSRAAASAAASRASTVAERLEVVKIGPEPHDARARAPLGEGTGGRGLIGPLVERAGHGIVSLFIAQLRTDPLGQGAAHPLHGRAAPPEPHERGEFG